MAPTQKPEEPYFARRQKYVWVSQSASAQRYDLSEKLGTALGEDVDEKTEIAMDRPCGLYRPCRQHWRPQVIRG